MEVPSWFKMHLRILIYEKHNYANIFIEHLDAVRMFKLLNVLETEEFFRFINSFSMPSLLRRRSSCACGEGKTPYGSLQIHF